LKEKILNKLENYQKSAIFIRIMKKPLKIGKFIHFSHFYATFLNKWCMSHFLII
jgi:hypothetical protein